MKELIRIIAERGRLDCPELVFKNEEELREALAVLSRAAGLAEHSEQYQSLENPSVAFVFMLAELRPEALEVVNYTHMGDSSPFLEVDFGVKFAGHEWIKILISPKAGPHHLTWDILENNVEKDLEPFIDFIVGHGFKLEWIVPE